MAGDQTPLLVDPADIERELVRVWREAASKDAANADQDQARVRAILSNFVVLFSGERKRAAAEVDSIIASLCLAHPSRFFLLNFSETNKEPSLKTSVSSRCVLAHSGNHVCSEEIHVGTGTVSAHLVPNLLASQYVADVPIVTFVLGDHFGEGEKSPEMANLFERLCHSSDFILYDSLLFSDYTRSVVPFLELVAEEDDENHRISDLNWFRSERFRVLIAEQFDGEQFANAAESVRSLELRCHFGKPGVVPAEALLLAAWFSDALGWEVESRGDVRGGNVVRVLFNGGTDRSPRVIDFVAVEHAELDSRKQVTGLTVILGPNDAPIELDLERNYQTQSAELSIESPTMLGAAEKSFCDFSTVRVPFRALRGDELLTRPLYSGGPGTIFLTAAHRALAIGRLTGLP